MRGPTLSALFLDCPDLPEMLKEFQANLHILQDSTIGLTIILNETRADVRQQFDEKQSVWKPNRPYTVRKKQRRNADMRILHETKTAGKRLRDAYGETGEVSKQELSWFYPLNKPYAKELDEGVTGSQFEKKSDRREERDFDDFDDSKLDTEFGSIFKFNTGSFKDLFKKPRTVRPKKKR